MSKIKAALVGYGSVGEKIHAPLISVCENLELVAVVERNLTKSKEKYPQVQIFKSLEALLEADAADLIIIVTPNYLHFDQAKLALSYGKHVVVDKPVTISSKEAKELKEIAGQKGLLLSVFQNRRLDGDFQTIQKILHEGILGRLVHFESHFDRFRPVLTENWREKNVPGNGITYDLGTHLIDQAYLLFGMPQWVSADIRSQRTNAVADDFFDITLGYGDVFVRLTASVLSNAPMPKFLLLGEKGSFSKFGLDIQERALKAEKLPQGADWGLESEESWGTIYLEDRSFKYETLRGDYRLFYENIAKAIQGIETPLVKIDEAIAVLQIIESAFESSQSGKRVLLT
ncbi:putative dehydrogenase [Belliella baltica DSM 15883]|uniref:Putative dehydrogenase n=1 Tax=Belliella baltica (strain DSM 15883 / CIP 108006 / LMG 21964 / BA134) TaxID=866536 RepID=I3Z229_BELBD|nr:Gfo/Idh/MocA family oxidoreductase [Belliella baltica]AFL83297.1 putative dehydrogenase [Belliella baltica DSM 15883]